MNKESEFEMIKVIEKNAKKELIDEICKFVRTDEFKASWVNARGVTFGDFLAQQLKDKFNY